MQGIDDLRQVNDLSIEYAYGDGGSDFVAFEEARIDPTRSFGVRRAANENCWEGSYAACSEYIH